MTERGRDAVERTATRLQIGPSALSWEDGTLVITIDECGAPLPRRTRGTIRVTPGGLPATAFWLDAGGRHVWQPIAPKSAIAVSLDRPSWQWTGNAYLDSNFGSEPLEHGFREWSWSRAHLNDRSVVIYDAERRDGSHVALALGFDPAGTVQPLPALPAVELPKTGWRIGRRTRADGAAPVGVRKTLEDTPFYARSLLDTTLYGEHASAFHESLSLDRFRTPIVQAMLPFRMPRQIF